MTTTTAWGRIDIHVREVTPERFIEEYCEIREQPTSEQGRWITGRVGFLFALHEQPAGAIRIDGYLATPDSKTEELR